MRLQNKRGQDLSIGTLILIVLGIVVLVLLILGFSIGWKDLFAKIGILSGGSNLETVVQACNLHASSKAVSSYCEFKQLTINSKTVWVNCEYPDVASQIENPLECSNSEQIVKDQCINLIQTKYKSKITKTSTASDLGTLVNDCTSNFDTYVNKQRCGDQDLCNKAITAWKDSLK